MIVAVPVLCCMDPGPLFCQGTGVQPRVQKETSPTGTDERQPHVRTPETGGSDVRLLFFHRFQSGFCWLRTVQRRVKGWGAFLPLAVCSPGKGTLGLDPQTEISYNNTQGTAVFRHIVPKP